MKTSIIILTYNKLDYTKLCINSIKKYTKKGTYEIIVIDNKSTDGTIEWLKNEEEIKVIFNDENLGFPAGCNQGIKISEGENILLLNNDTIVTPNWLENLLNCLYSSEDIGAVGAITNSCSNYQAIPVTYKNIDEMIEFAKNNNKSDSDMWEERLRLIGFCMLIKREVVNKVGFLDERFTPGNFEDDDYSLRIRKAGYRLMLCKDTFIHHFGSISFGKGTEKYLELYYKNLKKFEEKWSLNAMNLNEIRKDITMLIKEDRSCHFTLLHINCGGGGTLLDIKNQYPKSTLFGIEKENNLVINTNHFANIKIGDFTTISQYNEGFFDYIIFSNVYEIGYKDLIKKVCKYIKDNGSLIIILPNQFINKRDEIEYQVYKYSSNAIIEMNETYDGIILKINFHHEDYVKRKYINIKDEEETELIQSMIITLLDDESKLKQIFDDFESNKYSLDILIRLSIACYENKMFDLVIPILQKVLEMDENNKDALINMSLFLHQIGEVELAKNFLNRIADQDEEVDQIWQLLNDNSINFNLDIEQEMKFLLRRIENDIQPVESFDKIYQLYKEYSIQHSDFSSVIEKDIVNREKVLLLIGLNSYRIKDYEFALFALIEAYKLNPQNLDVAYNLAYMLYRLGENEKAVGILNDLEEKDEEIIALVNEIRMENYGG
ncbi:putative glycosyltransferase EpsH [Clostridium sp. N3C]|uniref:glycosyltransferase n=1 Tax=Clostridium sp. N3C TaxID=1776758 RepID=UPI00092DF6B5|nr:glycosyltransferase [Clostridium sp. N3C]SCN21293.1 putative glycosyltransferase EpsH [Clostridium sp. N3C]